MYLDILHENYYCPTLSIYIICYYLFIKITLSFFKYLIMCFKLFILIMNQFIHSITFLMLMDSLFNQNFHKILEFQNHHNLLKIILLYTIQIIYFRYYFLLNFNFIKMNFFNHLFTYFQNLSNLHLVQSILLSLHIHLLQHFQNLILLILKYLFIKEKYLINIKPGLQILKNLKLNLRQSENY